MRQSESEYWTLSLLLISVSVYGLDDIDVFVRMGNLTVYSGQYIWTASGLNDMANSPHYYTSCVVLQIDKVRLKSTMCTGKRGLRGGGKTASTEVA